MRKRSDRRRGEGQGKLLLFRIFHPVPYSPFTSISFGRELFKVADFGLAAVMRSAVRNTSIQLRSVIRSGGDLLGTINYTAPENFNSISDDFGKPPGDIYGTAMIAYELLTGMEPWRGEIYEGIIDKMRARSRPTLPRDVPTPFSDLIAE